MNFQLIHHHKWSVTEIENLLPFERDIYVQMLIKQVEEENEKQEAEMRKVRK